MEPNDLPQSPRRRGRLFPWVWAGIVFLAYLLHFNMSIYHSPGLPWACPVFAVGPFGLVWGCGVLVWWLARQPLSPVRKTCFILIVVAVAVPLVAITGFIWLLTHMAP
jgi:hypothetical protein